MSKMRDLIYSMGGIYKMFLVYQKIYISTDLIFVILITCNVTISLV